MRAQLASPSWWRAVPKILCLNKGSFFQLSCICPHVFRRKWPKLASAKGQHFLILITMQAISKAYWHLQNHDLFSQCVADDISRLCVISNYKEAKKGSTIYFAGDVANRIFFLKKGVVKITTTDDAGNEVIKDILNEGDLFGELPTNNSGEESGESAIAMTEIVSICSFTKADFEDMLEHNPAIGLRFSKMMGDKLKVMTRKYHQFMFKDVRTRLIHFFVEYGQEFGPKIDGPITVKNYLTQEEIAVLVGTSRQSAATTINHLESEEMLKYGRTHILLNMPKLLGLNEELSVRRH